MAPFAGFEDFDECVRTMTDEEGHDPESAESICGALQAEAKADHGNVDQLREALERGAGLIADVGVDLVSGVDVPAVDSKWTMLKSGGARKGHDFRADTPVLLSKDADDSEERRISYAAAMIPRELDKEGDVVATPTVEKAAHDFIAQNGGVDTDHSLIDGDGEVVESWVLKEEREFDLPDGGTETYGAGTWMVGIKWAAEPWERIKAGELTGLSIYGMAEHVELSRSAARKCADCGGELSATKSQNADTPKGENGKSQGMGTEADTETDDASGGSADGGDGPTIGEVSASVDDLAGTVTDLAETVESVKDAVETGKADAREAAEVLADELGFESADDVMDALKADDEDDDGDEEEDDEEEKADTESDESAETEPAEKRADDANLSKGADGRQSAAKGVNGDGDSTGMSYAALAEQQEGN